MYYPDREEAGRRLAVELLRWRGADPVVVALPRGGVPVAAPVARALRAPLDICVIRKLGVPFQPELGMGAIGEGGARVVNEAVVRGARVTPGQFAEVEREERAELERRAERYRRGRAPVPLAGRTVIVVDDGVATGSTALAACRIVRARGAAEVVLAVPVAPQDWAARLGDDVDDLVCPHTPARFWAIGEFYTDFSQTSDAEVVALLDEAAARQQEPQDPEITLEAAGVELPGVLTRPQDAFGLVLFAHGSGSGRLSPRNRYVAGELERAGLATLLFDLLTPAEEIDREKVFDTGLLGRRLAEVTRLVTARPDCAGLPVGYFGASTGAAAALRAAAEPDLRVAAVVSRGGRPDLAGPVLAGVAAPVLLIVGGADRTVLELNRRAEAQLRAPVSLAVVPDAGHLFEEPGALEAVAALAADWFAQHLSPVAR
ncbi:phosphoribosyltransferase family protein [Streptomyces sp. NRRL B-24484]|uniref:phosphoribosyltransferase family protein n=1 Tax=Streptomyces sp. NRRL B-24484 TaxID=1463833 RepID=UPI0004C12C63|nr:phosphoribosyltransferase family protein [Streptomyces sp. NRRL B-24484]